MLKTDGIQFSIEETGSIDCSIQEPDDISFTIDDAAIEPVPFDVEVHYIMQQL